MASKVFDNYDYADVRKSKSESLIRLRYVTIGFIVLIISVFLFGALVNSGLFNKKTEVINQPIADTSEQINKDLKEDNDKTQSYAAAKIPYSDPEGKFDIRFVTPYTSDQIVVIIKTPDVSKQSLARQESTDIISEAKKTVVISNVYYINNY